jgi:hypothetical protein
MNYLFLDSSPNKDKQTEFSSVPLRTNKLGNQKQLLSADHDRLPGSVFALPSLEKEQVDIQRSENELLILVNKMKKRFSLSTDEDDDEEDSEDDDEEDSEDEDEEEDEEEDAVQFSDLNLGTQFYVSSLSVVGLYILYKLMLKTR